MEPVSRPARQLPAPVGKKKPYIKSYTKFYRIGSNWYQPLAHARGFTQIGKASWYGKKFHGRKTASGEIYNMHAISAAHKTLPLGTWVSVSNLDNNKKINVRINDRGPFVKGRIIDLSYAAAKKIGIVGPGTARVRIVALGQERQQNAATIESGSGFVPLDYYKGNFTLQIGAFSDLNNAEKLKKELDPIYKNVHVTLFDTGDSTIYRVRAGKCATLEQAAKYEDILIKQGFHDVFTIAE
ncbi:septal ring lytic transglycosylase RlpA family protein [Desulfosarcina sp. BuS5]|uniref:septal ring lytic transglycosylase RlpA family protein n=1 Tax=Desulfosarcina sp. BuS5 TaxID=933262 RepID=UPI0023799947|nr:septal ring lytic transglycosylase RlpA family protein [Desulfosarcina sp. BuS5]